MAKSKKNTAMFKHLEQLVGKKVVSTVRDGGSDYTEECFALIFNDGTVAWIMSDPEGNGPGHLDIVRPTGGKKK